MNSIPKQLVKQADSSFDHHDQSSHSIKDTLLKREPRSFQTPPRPGRGRFDSHENAYVHKVGFDSGILLPMYLRDEIEEQSVLEYEARMAERVARGEAMKKAREDENKEKANGQATGVQDAGQSQCTTASQTAVQSKARTKRHAEASSELRPTEFSEQVSALPAKKRLAVYSMDAVKKLKTISASVDPDVNKRNAQFSEQLSLKGPNRRVGMPRSIESVLALNDTHPHFSEVLQFVADRISMQKVSRRPVRLPPMMLFGPPGVGKTHFCEALAAALNVPVRRHAMDQAETSSALLGSDLTWSNTRYGLIFELLALGDYANPVVILDELDKSGRNGSSRELAPPTSVLHSLLEPVSASRVRDISLDIELDASLITWIATANNPALIPSTLRSRLKEFHIQMPTAEQALLVARSVAATALRDSGIRLVAAPDRLFIRAVGHLTAREIYQATLEAAASAARRGADCLSLIDLPQEILSPEDLPCMPRTLLH